MGINLIPSDKYHDNGWGPYPFLGMVYLNIMNGPQPPPKIIYSHKCYLSLRYTMLREKILVRMCELVLGTPSDIVEGMQ